MLVISQNRKVLYDTASGTSITVEPSTIQGQWWLRGHDGCNLGVFDSEEEAIGSLLLIGDAAEEVGEVETNGLHNQS